jgi:DNA-directed RNA polymerase subunit RPC12/RpoP
MTLRCANCGGTYTRQQVLTSLRRSRPPEPLTKEGEAQKATNRARGGAQPECPGCGNRTLAAVK